MRTISISLLAVFVTGAAALAQSGNPAPGPADYAAFSQFVTSRNIFDPNRQPHASGRPRISPRPTTRSAPAFSLVGTMMYEKGMFAFFNGNNDDLKKALHVPGEIAGYAVTRIEYGRVTLEATNPPQKIELTVGDVMREENGAWQLAGPGDLPAPSDGGSESSYGSHGRHRNGWTTNNYNAAPGGSAAGSGPAPSASQANDILKRLMEKREQENQ